MTPRSRVPVGPVLALTLVLGCLFVADMARAESSLVVSRQSGKNVAVTSVVATPVSGGWHIAGTLQRRHFSPRRPLRGLVEIVVLDAAGRSVREETLQATTRFVPKGIRQISFNTVLEGEIPLGGSVVVTSVN